MASDRVTIRGDQTKGIPILIALANARALNRARIAARAVLARELNRETGVKISIIKRHIGHSVATKDNLEVTIRVDGNPVPAIAYRAEQTPTGVAFTTGGGSRAFLKGAFIATTKSGHRAVWSRHRPSRSRKGKPRSSPALPIFQRFGPPLSVVALRTEVLQSAFAAGEASFKKNLEHELQHRLKSIGAA
jgi:hypothetical protein